MARGRVPDRRPRSSRLIDAITQALGHRFAVALAVAIVLLWLAAGPFVGFTDTYQLVINTGTTIITFVMVFAIQHTTNRETHAMNLKLDELLRVTGADLSIIGAERESDEQLKKQQEAEQRQADGGAERQQGRGKDTGGQDSRGPGAGAGTARDRTGNGGANGRSSGQGTNGHRSASRANGQQSGQGRTARRSGQPAAAGRSRS